MNKLKNQIIKFGIVGFTCFFIDMLVFNFCSEILNFHYMIAGVFGFTISVTVNYLLSMKFVFERKEDAKRHREFIVFVILSGIGLLINSFFMYLFVDIIYGNSNHLMPDVSETLAKNISRVIVTGIVMCYNFISRKMLLEKKS